MLKRMVEGVVVNAGDPPARAVALGRVWSAVLRERLRRAARGLAPGEWVTLADATESVQRRVDIRAYFSRWAAEYCERVSVYEAADGSVVAVGRTPADPTPAPQRSRKEIP